MSKEIDESAVDAKSNVKAPAKAKATDRNELSEEATAQVAGKVEEHYEELGAKSKKQLAEGGKEVQVSLTNKTMVRFTQDVGHIKAGHEQEVSDMVFDIYNKQGVIEKV